MEKTESPKAGRKQMIPIMLTAFITPFMGSALNLSVTAISEQFSAGAVSIGWVVTAYLLASTALLIPFGKFADLCQKKTIFLTGIVWFSIFSLLCAFSWNVGMLILFRVGQGIGASMIFATNSAIIASNFPPSMRGQMMGLSVMVTYTGLSVGPVLGGLFNEYLSWKAIFLFAFFCCIPAFVSSVLILEDGLPSEGKGNKAESASVSKIEQMDLPGCILFSVSISGILFGLSDLTTMPAAKLILILSVLLFALFVFRELRTQYPVLDIRMFTESRSFALSNAAALLNYGASNSISYLISVYLQNVRGMSSDRAGLILIATPILQAVLSPIAGRLSDRHSPYRLASAGMLLTCMGILMLIFLDEETSLLYLIAALLIIGIGFGLFSSPNSNAIMSSADRSRYGVASSIMSASRTIGQTSSMAVVTLIIGVVLGNVTLASASSGSIVSALHIAFIVNTVLCAIGVFCSARR